MSRLAKKPIPVPQGVSVEKHEGFYTFNGPKGELKKPFPPYIDITEKNGELSIMPKGNAPKNISAMLGTTAALVKNAIYGVKEGFQKKLEIEGIGYRAQIEGGSLSLSLGFTHPVKISPPEGVTFGVDKNVISVSGADKEKVGLVAAEIRKLKPPEPYKGKGIRYAGEVIRRKAGKKAVAAS